MAERNSSRGIARENIGTETSPRGESGAFEERPPLGFQQRLVLEPVGNGLLRHSRMADLAQFGGERSLATPGEFHGPLQRGNVRFIHGHRKYTRNLVGVNKNDCLTDDKETCKVLQMAEPKRKLQRPPAAKPGRKRKQSQPEVGPDGYTLGQRVIALMNERNIGQTELARLCSQYYATFVPTEDDKVKQQHIFNLIQGQSTAWAVPLIAAVFDVSDIWLQYGIGSKDRKKA